MAITHLVSNHSYGKHGHISVYLDFAIGFTQTLLLALPFHGDAKLNENIIQDLPPNWIIVFLEFYALPHCIPFFPLKYLTNLKYISNWPILSKPTLTIPNNFLLHRQHSYIYSLPEQNLSKIQSNPDTAPPSLSTHGSLYTDILYYVVFQFTVTINILPSSIYHHKSGWTSSGPILYNIVHVMTLTRIMVGQTEN